MAENVLRLEFLSNPGILKDGTPLDADCFVGGAWVRFYRKKPQKMGGIQEILSGNDEIVRTIFLSQESSDGFLFLYQGRNSTIQCCTLEPNPPFLTGPLIDRTPVDYHPSPDGLSVWQIETVTTQTGGSTPYAPYESFVLALATPTAQTINNSALSTLYYGSAEGYEKLIPVVDLEAGQNETIQATGGFCVVNATIFVFYDNGLIRWNNGSSINAWDIAPTATGAGRFIIGTENFIFGSRARFGEEVGALFWSSGTLVKAIAQASPSGQNNRDWLFSYVSTLTTCLSARSVVSYEPYFYWVGSNTFYRYNGVVQEVANETNKSFFFDNLNNSQSAKVTSYVDLQYHEWHILFPCITEDEPDPQENNWEIIYNTEYDCWFDNPLKRAAAIRSTANFIYPLLSDSSIYRSSKGNNGNSLYSIYVHEIGNDFVDLNGVVIPINSHITALVTLDKLKDPQKKVLRLDRIVLDLIQTGDMTITIQKQGFPRSPLTAPVTYSFSPTDEFITLSEKGSMLTLTFASQTLDGFYLMGKTMLDLIVTADNREEPSRGYDSHSL